MTGKLTWAAGIYRRAKWAVSMLYAALAAHEAEVKSGEEALRRNNRALIPVKRFEAERKWLAELFREQRLVTKKTLFNPSEHVMIIMTRRLRDAGGLFLTKATRTSPWTVLRAYEYEVDRDDAKLLNFDFGSHKSHTFLEALAVLLALRADSANGDRCLRASTWAWQSDQTLLWPWRWWTRKLHPPRPSTPWRQRSPCCWKATKSAK